MSAAPLPAAPAGAGAGADAALRLEDLQVLRLDGVPIVGGVDLTVRRGEIVALVGESGCGKTSVALGCLGYARPGTRLAGGAIRLGDRDLLTLEAAEVRRMRGTRVSYVPQDPGTALNPALRIGLQLGEALAVGGVPKAQAADRMGALLESVQLPSDAKFRRRFPHQLSGGQQQRVAIAMALAGRPSLVVLDEPTTGLDVTTQARIIEEIKELRSERLSMLYVTHDLAVVGQLADRVAVMYAGRIVEEAASDETFLRPRHPYTRSLMAAVPGSLAERRRLQGLPGRAVGPTEHPGGCDFAPRCTHARDVCRAAVPSLDAIGAGHRVRCVRWQEIVTSASPLGAIVTAGEPDRAGVLEVEGLDVVFRGGRRTPAHQALSGVGLTLGRPEALGIVGESGSGKSTLARCVAGLQQPTAGRILYDGTPLAPAVRDRTPEQRRAIQLVFQNPDSSLNPRHDVLAALAPALRRFQGLSGRELEAQALALLDMVRLPASALRRLPRNLSGGEKQRVAVARALAARPAIIVCDEITSALDVSVQAAIIELLLDLREEIQTSLLFISHDLAVVRSVADRVLVLEQGVIREQGPADEIFLAPKDAYTRALLDAVPQLPTEAGASPRA